MSRHRTSLARVFSALRAARWWLACALLLAGCSAETPGPLRVASNNWPGYWPLYLAQLEGRLDARLQELSSATEVLRAFRNHRIDVAAFTIQEFLQLLDEGNDPYIVLVVDYSNGADSLIARPPLTSIAALRGHVIGAESTAMGAYVLRRALESGGLSDHDVKVAAFDFGDHENAYNRGLVDAIVTFEPTRSRLLAAGGHEVFSSAAIPGEIADVLVVDAHTAAQRQPELRKLVAAWYAAADSVRNEPRKAAERLANMTSLSGDQFQQAMSGLHLVTPQENAVLLRDTLGATLVRIADTMHAAGMLSHQFTPADMNEHIREIAPP